MKNHRSICLIALLIFAGSGFADSLSLYTETSFDDVDFDDNWDWWQQEPNYPDPCYATVQTEDALYFCAFDGASGHTNHDPNWPVDGNIDGVYSTIEGGWSPTGQIHAVNLCYCSVIVKACIAFEILAATFNFLLKFSNLSKR